MQQSGWYYRHRKELCDNPYNFGRLSGIGLYKSMSKTTQSAKFQLHVNMKFLPIIMVISIESITICLMLYIICIKLFPTIYLNPIDRNSIVLSPDKNLSHFYEPRPGWPMIYSYKSIAGDLGTATINSDSLNERFEYSIDKDISTYRIVTLGDSFTFGWFVNTTENYPEQLEYKLNNTNCGWNKIEVINLGVGGYDIEYSAHRFDVRGKKYNPDLIIWFVQNNDFEDISDYVIFTGMKKYTELLKDITKKSDLIQTESGSPGWTEARMELQKTMGIDKIASYQSAKLHSLGNLFHKKLVLMTFNDTREEYKNIMRKLTQSRPDTYLFDSIPPLKKPDESFPDYHPTPKGYKKISDLLYKYLLTENIIPCRKS